VAGFSHKLPKVREEMLHLLIDTYRKFGAGNLQITKLLTYIVKLSTDTNQQIKDASFECLIEIYRHVGEKLRVELKKKQLPETK
jgi:CLIP-associating protein 1/2